MISPGFMPLVSSISALSCRYISLPLLGFPFWVYPRRVSPSWSCFLAHSNFLSFATSLPPIPVVHNQLYQWCHRLFISQQVCQPPSLQGIVELMPDGIQKSSRQWCYRIFISQQVCQPPSLQRLQGTVELAPDGMQKSPRPGTQHIPALTKFRI